MSLFVVYFGTERTWPGLRQHTILFGPRDEALLRDIFHGRRLPDDFSLYLHAPTVTDPSTAPGGCGSFYVLSPVPHLGHAPVDPGGIVVRSFFTPRDFRERLGGPENDPGPPVRATGRRPPRRPEPRRSAVGAHDRAARLHRAPLLTSRPAHRSLTRDAHWVRVRARG